MFNRFSRSSKLKGIVKPEPDTISYFQEELKFDTGSKNLTCIEVTFDNKIIIGNQKGDLFFYILDDNNKLRKLYNSIRIQKGEVTRVKSINGVDQILVHIKSTMYFHYSQSGRSENLGNQVVCFHTWKKQGRLLLYLAEGKQVHELDLTEKAADPGKKIQKGIIWNFDDKVQKFMVNDKIVLALLNNNTLIMRNAKGRRITHDYSFPLNHLVLHPLDKDIFLILLENQKFNLGICGNSKGGLSTKYQQTFDLTHTLRVSSVVDNGYFLVISTGNVHSIFSKEDGKIIQILHSEDEAREGKGNMLAINQQSIVALSARRYLLVYRPDSIANMVKATQTSKTYKTLISLVNTIVEDPKTRRDYTSTIYQDFALSSLYNRNYDDAKECLGLYRFDPKEILEATIEDYLPGRSGVLKSYSKDMRLFVLNLMKETRDTLLLKGEDFFFTPEAVTRTRPVDQPISVREWLRIVDFALIRSFYGLNKFDDLFDFLRTKKKIYCAKVEELRGLLFDIEHNDVIDAFLREGILGELCFLFGNTEKGLDCLGRLNAQFGAKGGPSESSHEQAQRMIKYKALFKYTFEKATAVLLKQEKQPRFLQMLVKNLLWIRSNKQKMQNLFAQLSFNEQSIKEMKKEIERIDDEEVKLSIWDVFLGKLFETEGLNQADINSEFLIKNLESLTENSPRLGFERTLKILQDESRVFDYYRVYEEFLKFKTRLQDRPVAGELGRLVMMIEVEVLKNMDKPEYHRRAIKIMLAKQEFEMAEQYCAGYEGGPAEDEEDVGESLRTDNYFGMYAGG